MLTILCTKTKLLTSSSLELYSTLITDEKDSKCFFFSVGIKQQLCLTVTVISFTSPHNFSFHAQHRCALHFRILGCEQQLTSLQLVSEGHENSFDGFLFRVFLGACFKQWHQVRVRKPLRLPRFNLLIYTLYQCAC